MTYLDRFQLLFAFRVCATAVDAAPSLWNFSNPADRLAAESGAGTLSYYDPVASDWATTGVQFGAASSFGLPLPDGGDMEAMSFPAAALDQEFQRGAGFARIGPYGDTLGLTSNDTRIVMDVLFPPRSDLKPARPGADR